MKKALTIYVEDEAKLERICGTFVCVYPESNTINMINVEVPKDKKAVFFPKFGDGKWIDEVKE